MYLDKMWNPAKKADVQSKIEEGILEHEESVAENLEKMEREKFKFGAAHDVLNHVSGDNLYEWYAQAMQRRNREPLREEAFITHFFERESSDEMVSYGNSEKGYLLGFEKFGVFVPSHFAPKTLRGGYELFVKLGESDEVPAILAITDDLAATISKIPSWHKLEINQEIMAHFRGERVKKEIYYNSHPDVENLMLGLLMQYMNGEY